MSKFKVGDVITGIPNSDHMYGVTNQYGAYKVDALGNDGNIHIVVLTHWEAAQVGCVFYVEETWFTLLRGEDFDKFSHHKKRVEERHLKKASV